MTSFSNTFLSRTTIDALLRVGATMLAVCSGSLLLLVVAFLCYESWPAVHELGVSRFFREPDWFPTEEAFGLTDMIRGTAWASAGAVCLAAPLGVLSAVFCHVYAPPLLGRWFRRMIELLAGIPSVVYGFWGLVVLVPIIGRWHPPGPSLLAGILILTLMILPTITLITQASLSQVPAAYLQQAAALGFGRWAIVRHVMIPTARTGLLTGILLGAARALGETMAVLMVCGNVVQQPAHVFDPIRTLTANIALEMAYALGHHRSALFAGGLLLMGLVVGLVGLAEKFRYGHGHPPLR